MIDISEKAIEVEVEDLFSRQPVQLPAIGMLRRLRAELTRAEQRIVERDAALLEVRTAMGLSLHSNDDLRVVAKAMLARIADLEREVAALRRGYEQIEAWSQAYPVEVFPEPDWKRTAQVLKDAGLSLDSISASNMRHVIKRVQEIAIAYTGVVDQEGG